MKISLRSWGGWEGVDELIIDRFPFILGRDSGNQGSLPLAFVSRQHCQFTQRYQSVFVQDLESFNGTFVNGRRITQPTRLHNGDELGLGPLTFQISFVSAAGEKKRDTLSGPTRRILQTLKNPGAAA